MTTDAARLANALEENEDSILSVIKLYPLDLCEDLVQKLLISQTMNKQFLNLDHSRIEPMLQIRFLLRLIRKRIRRDENVWDKFLRLLESWGEHQLCEFLKSSSEKDTLEDDELSSERSVWVNDIDWMLPILAPISHKWHKLALRLYLTPDEIEVCRTESTMASLKNVLWAWLSTSSPFAPPSINFIIQALNSRTVSAEAIVARRLDEQHKLTYCFASTIVNQSNCEVQVEAGKSTLLLVQASRAGNVSYQWEKNGQQLHNGASYSGVNEDMLVVKDAHLGTEGEYTCSVWSPGREIDSDKMVLNVIYPDKKDCPPDRGKQLQVRSTTGSIADYLYKNLNHHFTLAAVIVVLSIVIGSFWSIGNTITPERFSTCRSREGCKPSLKQMSYLQFDESSESVNIIQELNIDCKDLGIVLNIPSGEIQSIWKSSGIIRNKCIDTIEYWLKGGGEMPATWGTFVLGLRRIKHNDLADRIEQQIATAN